MNKLVNKLNLGCGEDYREGWTNLDLNKEVKAEIYHDLEKIPYPFNKDKFDYILIDNTLEHVTQQNFIKVMEELHRITKCNGIIEIYVPHNSGPYAFSHLTHFSYFGCGTFDTFTPEGQFNKERYSKAKFRVREDLIFFHHAMIGGFKFLTKLPINWFFNLNWGWQRIMEKFQVFGFDEIHYELKVVK